MSTTYCFKMSRVDSIPPDGQSYFDIELSPFDGGAVTVTAVPTFYQDPFEGKTLFMEVIQMATRLEWRNEGRHWFLDVVVRNNSHVGTPQAMGIDSYDVFVSWVTP